MTSRTEGDFIIKIGKGDEADDLERFNAVYLPYLQDNTFRQTLAYPVNPIFCQPYSMYV